MRGLREHLTYANVMSTLAVFAVLGGTAYAANTVFSSDIVNNEVYGVDVRDDTLTNGGLGHIDLKGGAVRSSEVAANSLNGGDIDESTLAVPGRIVDVQQGGSYSDICTVAAEWRECAAVTVNVPANKTYRVMIDSAGSFYDTAANRVKICSSARNSATPFVGTDPTVAGCPNTPTGITLAAGEIKNAATNGVQTLTGGGSGASYIVSTAVRPDEALNFVVDFDFAVIHTLVTVSDATTGGPTGAKSAKLKR